VVRRIVFALICGWLLLPHRAQAKSKLSASARLELQKGPGTEGCLDQRSLSHAVESRLRRRAFREDVPATLFVKIAITRDRAAWSALLTMHDGSGAFLGRRSLTTEAADCSALDDSLALVVALLVDSPPPPELDSSAEAEPAAPLPPSSAGKAGPNQAANARSESDAKAASGEAATAIQLPPDTPAPRAPWRLQLAAGASFAIGVLPGFAPGLELGFGAKAPTLPELRVFAGWYAQREQRRAELDAGAQFDAVYLGLEICPFEQQLGIAQLFVCGGQSLGQTRARAFGFDENWTSTHLTFALVARGGLQLALSSHWALRLGGRAELPLDRGVYRYGAPDGSQEELFQPSPVAAVLDLGLVVRL